MSQFLDLPSEVQTEIFTFLSVKHLGTILSINKSTREEIMISETFWNELINNYSRIVNDQPSPKISQINYDLSKTCLLDLIKQKQNEIEMLIETHRKLEHMEYYLQIQESEYSSSQTISISAEIDNVKLRIESIQKKIKAKLVD